MTTTQVPFFRPDIGEAEIDEVVAVLRSGWLTTGPRVETFEQEFARAVGARYAVALNSCTAALHLALEALHLRPGDGVLVPTMTFAATAEVVRYMNATPILVDCDDRTLHMDLSDADAQLQRLEHHAHSSAGQLRTNRVVGLMPVHVGGLMMDMAAVANFAEIRDLWVVEDAAHAFPAAWRSGSAGDWQRCGDDTASVTCFSFYANKTITTGEGGMAVTSDRTLAERIRLMALHGLSHDAWGRYSGSRIWDYKILESGFKYNLTDVAAAIGLHQLRRAEEMRCRREDIARRFCDRLRDVGEIELPADDSDRIHAWHLFPIKLRLEKLSVTRDEFIDALHASGIMCSVHWRPLHLHPYYQSQFGYSPRDCPRATALFERLISLPIFPSMTDTQVSYVTDTVRSIVQKHAAVRTHALST